MRGRTNITGGGMNLNAEVQEFTVASGKSVVSGDFVEHYTYASEKTLISADFSTSDHVQIGNDSCLSQSGGALYLLKQTANGLEIVGIYNDYIIIDYIVLSDGGIVVLVKGAPYIVRLNISEEMFRAISVASGIPDGYIGTYDSGVLAENENKLYLLNTRFGSGSIVGTYAMYVSVYIFSLSQTGVLYESGEYNSSRIKEWDNIVTDSTKLVKAMFIGGVLRIISQKKVSDTTSYRLLESQIESGKLAITNGRDMFSDTYTRISEYGVQLPIYVNNKHLLWAYGRTLYLCNLKTNITNSYLLEDLGFDVYKGTGMYSYEYKTKFSRIGEDKIAVFFVGGRTEKQYVQTAILKISDATGISLLSNIFTTDMPHISNDIGVIYLNGIVNDLMYSGGRTYSYAISYDSGAELLTEKVNKSYVQPYTGGLAIGVAKQSGKAGQTIEVYVAKPSA